MLGWFKKLLVNKSIVYNLVANYGTTISGSLLSLLFTPLYIKYIGIEAYGIIGFIASIMIFLNFMDLGMGQTVNREMAKFHKDSTKVDYINNLVFSLQSVYMIIGVGCALVVVLAAPLLAEKWLNPQHLSTGTVAYAFTILGITIACRWPYSFFASALRGMQLQVLLNSNEIFWNLLRTIGSFVVLKYFQGNIISFLWYQCIIVLLQTLSSVILCWRFIQKPTIRRRFDLGILKSLSGYIASMGVASILAAMVMQLDKIILSKTLPGEDYGYYMLSNNLAMSLFIVSTPVAIALFPHFTNYLHKKQQRDLIDDFHKYTRILSVTLLPAFIMLCFFTPELIWIWTKNQTIVERISPLVRIMLVGTVLDAYMVVPNTLLLAANKTRFILICHSLVVIILVPFTYFLSMQFGVIGGAVSLAFILGGYFVFSAPFVFKLFLPGQYFKWLWNDIVRISLPLLALAACIRILWPSSLIDYPKLSFVILSGIGLSLIILAMRMSGITYFDKYMFWKKPSINL